MLLSVLVCRCSASFASVDFGTEFFRIARSSLHGEPELVPDISGQVQVPCAVAFQTTSSPDSHLSDDAGFNATLKIGDEALRYLKHHPRFGTPFVNRLLGRSNTSLFPLPSIANTTELLSLALTKLFMNPRFGSISGVAGVLPRYLPLAAREAITQAMYLSRLPVAGLFDDDASIAQLFCVRHRGAKRVLFVDIGASGVRAFRIEFFGNASARETSYVWDEDTGDYAFRRRVARALKISERKAARALRAGGDFLRHIRPDLAIVGRLMQEAANGPIDEVQLLGGCSQLQGFVHDTFRNVPVRRGMTDGALKGSVYLAEHLNGIGRFQDVEFERAAIYASTIECAGVFADYCLQNGTCDEMPVLQSTICSEVVVRAQKVPKGFDDRLAVYQLVNISDFRYDDDDRLTGVVLMKTPSPVVVRAVWCAAARDAEADEDACESIKVAQKPLEDLENKMKFKFVSAVLRGDDEKREIIKLKERIATLLDDTKQEEMTALGRSCLKEGVSLSELKSAVKALEAEKEEL
jgi:hypothetical protein